MPTYRLTLPPPNPVVWLHLSAVSSRVAQQLEDEEDEDEDEGDDEGEAQDEVEEEGEEEDGEEEGEEGEGEGEFEGEDEDEDDEVEDIDVGDVDNLVRDSLADTDGLDSSTFDAFRFHSSRPDSGHSSRPDSGMRRSSRKSYKPELPDE